MDATEVQLIIASIESVKSEVNDKIDSLKEDVISPLRTEVKNNGKRISKVEKFNLKLVVLIAAAGGGSGALGFLSGKFLDKVF